MGKLIVTWPPQYAFFFNPYEWAVFTEDLKRFARLCKDKLIDDPPICITKPNAADFGHLTYGTIAVDIETGPATPDKSWTGKDPTQAVLRTIGFGNEKFGLSIAWETAGEDEKLWVKRILADPRVTKIFHNGPWFDLRVLERYDLHVQTWEDSRDCRRAMSATSALSLRYLASIYNDTNPWKEDDEEDSKGLVFTDDYEKLKKYNAQDCVETSRIWNRMTTEPDFQEERVQTLYQLHKDLSQIAAEMHTTGFLVDERNRQYLAWGLEKQYYEQEAKLLELVGKEGFRCTPNDMRSLIYKRHETDKCKEFSLPDPIDPSMWASEDTISIDYGSLLLLLTDPGCPDRLRQIIDVYWEAESAWKARSTFVTSKKVMQAIGPDGRLRPGWNSCGTDTGRWSCSEPNIMNLEEYLRAMYTVGPGRVLVHADFSQLELRVMAAVAGDESLAAALLTGDVYTVDAREWFGLPSDMDVKKLKPAARKQAKIIHLASQYAAGTPKVYLQALGQDRTIKYQTVKLLHQGFGRTYYQTLEYWHDEQRRVRECGYSESRILHRRRTYPKDPPITEVANYPIQSTAADIVNLAMVDLWKRLKAEVPSARIITQLHDAFDVECWEEDASKVQLLMTECMQNGREINGQRYEFPVEIKLGRHWNEV